MATWVCRSGSPARESRWVNRGRDQAGHVDLPDPVPPLPGEQCVAFVEVQRILHGSPVRLLDLCSRCGSATAHNVDTDLTGEKVRS
jgi:hypothetical protein